MFSQACVKNSVHSGGCLPDTPWADPPNTHPLPGRHILLPAGYCSGRYASYWNAFLFNINWKYKLNHTIFNLLLYTEFKLMSLNDKSFISKFREYEMPNLCIMGKLWITLINQYKKVERISPPKHLYDECIFINLPQNFSKSFLWSNQWFYLDDSPRRIVFFSE